jgi:hypothetical protein
LIKGDGVLGTSAVHPGDHRPDGQAGVVDRDDREILASTADA